MQSHETVVRLQKFIFNALIVGIFFSSVVMSWSASAQIKSRADRPMTAAEQTAIVQSFRGASDAIPRRLLESGYSEFGDLKLASFIEASHLNSVSVVPWVDHIDVSEDGAGERNSAEWSRPKNESKPGQDVVGSIKINAALWAKTAIYRREIVAFHENLGLAGLHDRRYTISTGLWLLANPEIAKTFSPDEKTALIERINRNTKAGQGGVIGVGGGGDEDGVGTKLRFLMNAATDHAKAKSKAERESGFRDLLTYLDMTVEIERETATMNGCQVFLLATTQIQKMTFDYLKTKSPEDMRAYSSVDELATFCRAREKKSP